MNVSLRSIPLLRTLGLAMVAVLWTTPPVSAATGVWVPTAAGTYFWLDMNYGDANTPITPPWGVTGAGTDASPFVLNPVPNAAGDVASIDANIAGNQTIVLNAAITLGTLNLGDADGSHTITIAPGEGGSLIISNGGSTAQLNKALTSTSTDTISANISLVDNFAMNVLGGRLDVTGVISGTGTGITKSGAGTLFVSGASTYTGGTTIHEGVVVLGSSTEGGLAGSAIVSGPLGTGTVTIGDAGPVAIQSDSAAARTLSNAIVANGNFTLGAVGTGSVMLGGPVDLGAGAPRVITAVGNQFITGVVTNGGLSLAGTGTLHLRGANGFSGASTLGAGSTLVIENNTALGTAALTMGGNTLAADTARTITNGITLTGDLTLGADPRVAGNYDGQLTLGGTMDLGGANRVITVTTSGVPTTLAGASADTISGNISGGGITKEGNGRLILSGTNSTITGFQINSGVLQFNTANSLGTTNPASVAAGVNYFMLNGGVLAFNNGTQTNTPSNAGLNIAANSTIDIMAAGTLVLFNNTAATTTGTGDLTKVGTGALQLAGGGTSTWSGNLNIVQGAVILGTTGGASNGRLLAAVNSIAVQSAAVFRVSNGTSAAGNNGDRVNNAAGITMNGGLLELAGGAGISFSETFGTTTINRGANGILASQAAATFTSTLTISDLVRNTGATVNFASNTALTAGSAGLGQTARNSIILSQLNGAATPVGFVGGWATVNTAAATNYATSTAATEWAKYDSTLGVQPFLAADYNGGGAFAQASMTSATYHAKITAGSATPVGLTGPRTAGSLHLSATAAGGNITITQGGNTFTIDSGGILVSGTTTTTAHSITGGVLAVGAGNELIVNTAGSNSLNIGSTLNGTMALTKSGNGVLLLTGVNTFTGGVYLNQGTIRLAAGPNGISLALPSSNNISVVTGTLAGTGAGAIVIQNDITIYNSLTLGDSSGAARHILTGDITLAAPNGGIASIIAHTNTTAQILGNISGGSLRIAQVGGTGRVALQGNNAFAATDRIQVDSGFLTVGSAGALGSAKIVLNGGGLETGFGYYGAISNDVLLTANSRIGGAVHGHGVTLTGTVDLGGTTRTITNDGAGVFTEFAGVITNGGLVKDGPGVMILSNANNNYMGGTSVLDGFIHLQGDGVAGANVFGNDITINSVAAGDAGIKLDGPSNLGSNQILTFNLPAAMTTGTQALSLGSGFSGNSNTNRMVGFQSVSGGTGTGIMNIRINDVANGKLLISLDGLTLNQDVIGGVGGTNSAAPNVRVWIGASAAGGVIAGPISAGLGGNYRLGGGLDASAAASNLAGVLQVNADVLSGSGILYIGAEDNTALSNIGSNSVVWMNGEQSDFSGIVSIGAGGILNVAEGSYLGTGTNITFRGGTLRVLNESGQTGLGSSFVNTSFADKDINVGVGGGTIRHDSGTGNSGSQWVQFGDLTIDASSTTAANRTLTIAEGGGNNGGIIFDSLTLTNNGTNLGVINVTANFARITGDVVVGAGGIQKAGSGSLILDTPTSTTLGGVLDMNGGTLILTNPGNFTAPSTNVTGSSGITARSNAGTYALNIGNVTLGNTFVLTFGNANGSGPTSSTVNFGSAITVSGAARTLTVRAFDDTTVNGTGAVALTGGNLTFDIQAGYYVQSGLVSGTNALAKTGRGVLELTNASNSFNGINAGIGTVLVSTTGAQGTGTISFTNGSGQFLAGNGVTISNALQITTGTPASPTTVLFGGLSGNSSYTGNFNIAAVSGLSPIVALANFDAAGTTTFSGVISQGNSGVNNITKTGNGTVVLSNANTYGSASAVTNTVQRGTLEGIAQVSGSPFGSAGNAFVIGGGALKLTGIASDTATTHAGSLTVGGNNFGGKLIIDSTAGGNTSFTVGLLGSRAGRGTLVIIPQTGGFGTTENLAITTAPTGANFLNGIIAPYVVKQASASNGTGNFVTMSGTAVVDKTYTAGTTQGDLNAIATTATTVFDNNTATTLTGNTSVFSLRTDSDINLNGFALNIGDQTGATSTVSGLILNNNANINGSGNSVLRTGNAELHVFVGTGFTSTISASIASLDATTPTSLPFTTPNTGTTNTQVTTNTGLTKSGNGTLILTGANRYTGITTVAGGTLQAGAANVLGQFSMNQRRQSSDLQIAAGATFDMSGAGFDQTIGSLAGQGVINLGSNKLTVGNGNIANSSGGVATITFSGQILATAGATLQKTGAGVLELTNLQTGSLANSAISNIFVDQGTLRVHVSDGSAYGAPNGDTFAINTQSAIANGSTFQLRGGTLDLRYNHGDVTSNAHTLRTNYNIVSLLSSGMSVDSGLIGTNSNKQISINNLTLNRFTFTVGGGNTNILQVDGTLTLTDNAQLVLNSDLIISGTSDITDGGNYYTLTKQGGGNLSINADTTFVGGTVSSLGRILFGQRGQWSDSYEDSPNAATIVYNSTAKLGTGDIWLNSYSNVNATNAIRLAETNLHSDQLVFVRSGGLGAHQTQVELMHDAALSDYHLRSTTQGSLGLLISPGNNSTNVGRWTNTINLQQLGNGRWGIGGVNDAVYDNAVLGVGAGETYRFFSAATAGGALIFNHENTLTGSNRVEIGQSAAQFGGTTSMNSNAVVLLAADQDYTGKTMIYRGAAQNSSLRSAPQNALRVYGDLSTSGIENYGRLELIGAGRLTNDAGVNVVPLKLRIGSYLLLDYISGFNGQVNSAGNYLTDTSAVSGINPANLMNKFQDDAILVLPGSTLELRNFNTRDTQEVIGGLSISGLSDVVLGTNTNGAMVLELGSAITFNSVSDTLRISGTALGTAQPTGASSTAHTRFVFTNPAHAPTPVGTLTNGVPMLSPRFFYGTSNTFLTYTHGLGFIPVAPNVTSTSGMWGASSATDYVDLTTTAVTLMPTTQNVFALRTSVGISQSTPSAYTVNIGSGGLILNNGAAATYTGFQSTTQANAIAGTFAFPGDAYIWAVGGFSQTIRNNITTGGVLSINGVTSSQVILAGNNTINGDIVLNAGTLQIFNSNNDGTTTTPATYWNSGTVNPTGGSGSNIVLLGANGNNASTILPRLELRNVGAGTITNRTLVIGTADQAVPYVEISTDRAHGATTNQTVTIGGGLTVNGQGSEGTIISFTNGNDYDLTFTGPVALNTVSTNFNVNNTSGTHVVTLLGAVSGSSSLIKTGSGFLSLNTATNSYTGGTYLNGGTLQVSGTGSATATFLGTGPLFVNGGVLQINGADNTTQNHATGANNSIIVNGNFQLNVQGGTNRIMRMGNTSTIWQTSNSPVIRIDPGTSSATFQWMGGVRLYDTPILFVNIDQGNASLRGGLIWGNNTAGAGFSGSGMLQKAGHGNLTFNFGAGGNTFSGDINVFQGGIRAEQANDKYTTGNITLMPGTWITARANGNATYDPNQIKMFMSNSTALSGIVLRGTTDAYSAHLNASSIFTGNADGSSVGVPGAGTNGGAIFIEGTYSASAPVIDMSTVFGGYWYLAGSQQGGTYSRTTLGAGAADTALYGLSNTGVYRLGGGDGTLTISTVLTGANVAVQVGKAWATNGRGTVILSGNNTYGGGTVIGIGRDRGTGAASLAAINLTTGGGTSVANTPLGLGAVEVYGRMQFGGATGAANSTQFANDNVYTFHPGSRLRFEFNETTANTITQAQGGKWGDNVAIVLNGTSLEVNGETALNSTDNHEIVGDITFGRSSEIRVVGNGTNGTAALSTPTLTRNAATYGTLRFTHTANVLGSLGSTTNDAENFFITNFATGNTAGNGNWGAPTGTGHYSLTNDAVMLNPYMVSVTDMQWMRYDSINGKGMQSLFSNGTSYGGDVYQRFSTAGTIGTGTTSTLTNITAGGATPTYGANVAFKNDGTEILDISAVTATLSSNLDVMALRMGGSGANLFHDGTNTFTTVQIRSGGMLLNTTNNENTIRANLIFGTANTPGVAYVYSHQSITNLDGQITATDFVKFGAGTVRIAQDQRNFTGKWVVNQGTLEFDTVGAVGISGTNQILLNGGSASNTDTLSIPSIQFVLQNNGTAQSGDLSLSTISHGLITVVDAGQIRFFAPSDRQIKIGDVSLTTTGTTKGLQPGLFVVQSENSRTIGNFGNVTLDDDYVFKVEAASFSNGSVLGMGSTVGARFNNLNNQGLYDITKIGDGLMYLGDISTSFTGSRFFTVNEGAVRVEHATGSLGAAGTKFIVDNGGAIDIAVNGFNPLGTLIQNVGSIERWSVNGARTGSSFTLGTGVHLQINTSQTGTQTINLTGGSLMGYLAADLDEIAVIRTLDAGITINLLADSYLGQIYPFSGTLAYDMGKQNGYIADPFNPRLNGALLDIKGNITGSFDLTKVGTDVIQISSTGNSYENTIIKGGVLLMGAANALPTTKMVTTSGNGTLDLNGFTTTVGSIGGTTGTITSGATTATNFNVGGDNSDFSYAGIIAQGVRIRKQGSGEFTLGSTGQAATIALGNKTVTVTSTDGWYVGMPVAGPGIPSGTTIAAILNSTTIILSQEPVAAGNHIAPANIHWGGMEIVEGSVKVSDDAALGLVPNSEAAGADNITFSGGTFHAAETFATATTRGVLVNSAGGTITVDGTKTLTVGGKVVLNGRMTAAGAGNSVFNGVVSGSGSFVKTGSGTATFNAANTHTGKVEVAQGTVALGATGSIADATWLEVKSGATFDASAVAGGAQLDGVVSGEGNITGTVVITSNKGTVSNVGVLLPGSSSVDLIANAGDQNGTLTFQNLTLAGSASPQVRALLTVTTATLNDAVNIKTNIDNGTLLAYFNSQEGAWNSAAIGNHDFINVTGTLSLGKGGQIVVEGWVPQYGDVLDLFDWTSVVLNDFSNGAATTGNHRLGGLLGDLNLPTLGAGLAYDLTLFNTSGILLVVPEPGRASLLLLGLATLCLRRRRPRGGDKRTVEG